MATFEECQNNVQELLAIKTFIAATNKNIYKIVEEQLKDASNNCGDQEKNSTNCKEMDEYNSLLAEKELLLKKQIQLDYALADCNENRDKDKNGTSSNTEAAMRTQIINLKQTFELAKDVTGVRFAYNAPEDVVSGFVSMKGETPKETKFLPFTYPCTSTTITEDIWKKMDEVAAVKLIEDQ